MLYTPDHHATLWSLGVDGARKVIDLWADRTTALGRRGDVDHVLVFENRGAEVGATIDHPHGQIYAYDHVPDRPAARLAARWRPDPEPGERSVASSGSWRAWVPHAPRYPIEVVLAPVERVPDLPTTGDGQREEMATLLVDVLTRLDRLYDRPLPYMMWLNQRPTVALEADAAGLDEAWFNVEIVSPWRAAGVQRFIAAAEVAADEYFNPVVPEDLAARLRALG